MKLVQLGTVGVIGLLAGWAVSAQAPVVVPPELDAVVAAPDNHRVLFENDHIRLLEVRIQPGRLENVHGHANPSVFIFDAPMPRIRNRVAASGVVREFGPNFSLLGDKTGVPLDLLQHLANRNAQLESHLPKNVPASWATGPEAPHQVENLDTFPAHFYRMEFKRIEGDAIKKRTSY